MDFAIRLQIEELPEKVFVATSEDVPGLVVQGETLAETLEFAKVVTKELIQMRRDLGWPELDLPKAGNEFTVLVAA